jgi:hypothetical protein
MINFAINFVGQNQIIFKGKAIASERDQTHPNTSLRNAVKRIAL